MRSVIFYWPIGKCRHSVWQFFQFQERSQSSSQLTNPLNVRRVQRSFGSLSCSAVLALICCKFKFDLEDHFGCKPVQPRSHFPPSRWHFWSTDTFYSQSPLAGCVCHAWIQSFTALLCNLVRLCVIRKHVRLLPGITEELHTRAIHRTPACLCLPFNQ